MKLWRRRWRFLPGLKDNEAIYKTMPELGSGRLLDDKAIRLFDE